jgi:hypothetical protein
MDKPVAVPIDSGGEFTRARAESVGGSARSEPAEVGLEGRDGDDVLGASGGALGGHDIVE